MWENDDDGDDGGRLLGGGSTQHSQAGCQRQYTGPPFGLWTSLRLSASLRAGFVQDMFLSAAIESGSLYLTCLSLSSHLSLGCNKHASSHQLMNVSYVRENVDIASPNGMYIHQW